MTYWLFTCFSVQTRSDQGSNNSLPSTYLSEFLPPLRNLGKVFVVVAAVAVAAAAVAVVVVVLTLRVCIRNTL